MLYEFVETHRDEIIATAREKLTAGPSPAASAHELENGVPLFLTQLAEMLRAEESGTRFEGSGIQEAATRHGRDLLALGFTVSEVVHDYGDICQAVTELAIGLNAPITTEEFQTLNRCLDTAIAEAVTEHSRLTTIVRSTEQGARVDDLAQDVGAMIESAILAFEVLQRGTAAINGSTGLLLGRNLLGLKALIDTTLSDVRLEADRSRRQQVSVSSFLMAAATHGRLNAEHRGLRLTLQEVDPSWTIRVDPRLLESAVTHLLNNAFAFTPAGGDVVLRAEHANGQLLIGVEDERRGSPGDAVEMLQRSTKTRAGDSHELSLARKAVRALEGHITRRNMPGKGCVFIIHLALTPPATRNSRAAH